MDKQTATTLAGSQSELARILGITRAAVFHWKTIPKLRIYQLKELRPDWFNDSSTSNTSTTKRLTHIEGDSRENRDDQRDSSVNGKEATLPR